MFQDVNAATIAKLNAHLGPGEVLRGCPRAALRLLGSLGVAGAFRELARGFAGGVLDPDETLAALVRRAWVLRLAVARRHEVGGVGPGEALAAARADEALAPHWEALLVFEDSDTYLGTWDVAIDVRAWWGRLGGAAWAASEALVDGLLEAGAGGKQPPPVWEVAADLDNAEYFHWERYRREAAADRAVNEMIDEASARAREFEARWAYRWGSE